MIQSQKPINQPSQSLIQQLLALFKIYIDGPEGCRQKSYQLLEKYPLNLTVIEIAAACDSIIGKHSEAIAGYQKCLQIAPQTLAYANNQAWNFIQLKDYEIAMTLLSDIKDKWNHPAIYFNWITILENIGQNHSAVQQAIRKRDQFLRDYPQYRGQGNNGLIHTFLLKAQDNYTGETQDLRTQIFQIVEVLSKIQRAPVNLQTLNERLKFMEEKINLRKLQEQKSGFVIDSRFKIALVGLELLQTKILNNYQERFSDQLQKYVLKSIEFLNNHLFSEKVDDNNFNYKAFEESKLAPTVFQIIEIGQFMQQKLQHLTGSQQIGLQVRPQIKVSQKIPQQKPSQIYPKAQIKNNEIKVQKPINQEKINDAPIINQKFIQKVSQIKKNVDNQQQAQQKLKKLTNEEVAQPCIKQVQQKPIDILNNREQEDLKVRKKSHQDKYDKQNQKITQLKKQRNHQNINQKGQIQQPAIQGDGYQFLMRQEEVIQIEIEKANFLVEKLRIEGQNQGTPLLLVLHFKQKAKNSFIIYINHRRINQQILKQPNLPNLQRLNSQTQKAQVKRYYFILTNVLKFYNFYGTRNFLYERQGVRSHLDCYHYLQLISPVLDHLFEELDYFTHYKVGNTYKKIHSIICNYINETRKKGDFLRSFNKILKRIHETVQSCQSPVQNLLQSLLTQQNLQYSAILLNNNLISVDGSTKYHEHYISQMNKDRQGISDQNWLIFNVSILLISTLEGNEDNSSLQKKFLDCYYSSRVTEPLRSVILRKFFNANNQVPLIQKVSLGFRKIFTKIMP